MASSSASTDPAPFAMSKAGMPSGPGVMGPPLKKAVTIPLKLWGGQSATPDEVRERGKSLSILSHMSVLGWNPDGERSKSTYLSAMAAGFGRLSEFHDLLTCFDSGALRQLAIF